MRRLALLTVSGLLLLSIALAQQPAATPQQNQSQPPRPIPLPHLYLHFLLYQRHLDEAAAQREKQGENGDWLRTGLQKRLGFTDGEFAPVRASSERLSAKIADLNARARAIVAADQQARKQGLIPPGSPPPGLEKLKALDAERNADIDAEIATLNQALSPANAASLQSFSARSSRSR